MQKNNRGFTLIELFAAIVIIAILMALVYPFYHTYLLKSRRSDGITAILDIQAAQEKYRTSHASYGTLEQIWGTVTSSSGGFYSMSISNNTATGYTITATATGSQAADTDCSSILFTKNGSTETRSPGVCWQ